MSGVASDDALRLEAELLVEEETLLEVEMGRLMYGISVAPETVELWINGMLQPSSGAYTANETVIVFVEALQAGDTLRVSVMPSTEDF